MVTRQVGKRLFGTLGLLFLVVTQTWDVRGQSLNTGAQLKLDCRVYKRVVYILGDEIPDEPPRPLLDANSGSAVGSCLGLVRGVFQISGLFRPTSEVCYPPATTLGQAIDVVLHYLEEHPDELHETDSLLVLRALQHEFPCQ